MYINKQTKQVVSEQEVRFAYPNTSFSLPFTAPDDYAWVFPTPQPAYDFLSQQVIEIAPVLSNLDKYEQQWEVVDLGPEQVASNTLAKALSTQASIISAVQARLDSFAQTKFYDGILSACTYATSAVPKFALEGQYAVTARDTTWATATSILETVIAGTRPVPSGYAEIEPELPVLSWPEVP